jgi:hypothetical protein
VSESDSSMLSEVERAAHAAAASAGFNGQLAYQTGIANYWLECFMCGGADAEWARRDITFFAENPLFRDPYQLPQ